MIKNHDLIKGLLKKNGRNNQGKITIRHRGGGKKFCLKKIDYFRDNFDIPGIIQSFRYDSFNEKYLALVFFASGEKKFLLRVNKTFIGNIVISSDKPIFLRNGFSTKLKNINIGTKVHNIQTSINSNYKLVRSSGCYALILGHIKNLIIIRMPSKKIIFVNKECRASIGVIYKKKKQKKKAGDIRRKGIRPTVRGTAMNAVDHPHGGGEGKSPVGLKFPKTPWGFNTKKKNYNKNKISFIKKK